MILKLVIIWEYIFVGTANMKLIMKMLNHILILVILKIQDCLKENDKVFVFLGEGTHKIKKKAEQIACNEALAYFG